jgi:hemoglobin-like flavoprotein
MARMENTGTGTVFDSIDHLAIGFLVLGGILMVSGTLMDPPGGLRDFLLLHFSDWTPGLITDGLLLLVVNHILRRHERRRVVAQVASLSNEFALDAVRRVRQEGWHADGSLEGIDLERARLAEADLNGARMSRSLLSSADLRGASLHHTDLREADLTAANLRGADLRWCDLRGAKLRWADLREALVDGAQTRGADLRGAAMDPRTARVLGTPVEDGESLLTDEEADLLRGSLAELRARGTAPIEDFYERLFEAEPRLRAMFNSGPEQQAAKFLHSLTMIVQALDAPERHMPVLRKLGERHAGYGVRPEHFELVTGILLEVLETHLGGRFTEEVREAWSRGLRFIAAAMIEAGARGPAQGRSTARGGGAGTSKRAVAAV